MHSVGNIVNNYVISLFGDIFVTRLIVVKFIEILNHYTIQLKLIL